jgi:hypothetical protein
MQACTKLPAGHAEARNIELPRKTAVHLNMATLIGYWLTLTARCIARLVSVRPRLALIPTRKHETATRTQNVFVSTARHRNRR